MEQDRGQERVPPLRAHPSLLRVPQSFDGERADVFLSRELPLLSRTRMRQKIQMGESFLNGHRYATSTRLRAGDLISIKWRGEQAPEPGPDLEVLFDDEHLLAVNKPAGVASHPVGIIQSGTVVQFARRRFEAEIRRSLERGDMSFYPTLVNRLDRFTSGVVLVAKTRGALGAMQALVIRRQVSREYLALVEGCLEHDEGTIDLPIGPDAASRVLLKRACRSDGKQSVTAYAVIERMPAHTLVRVMPLTGRQHQIRVHFAAIGHPVVGDLLYKDEALFLAARESLHPAANERHCLHARRASFTHPLTGTHLVIEAPAPADFESIVDRCRGLG